MATFLWPPTEECAKTKLLLVLGGADVRDSYFLIFSNNWNFFKSMQAFAELFRFP